MSEKPPTGPTEHTPHESEARKEVVPVVTPTMAEEDPKEKAEKKEAIQESLHTRSEQERAKTEPEQKPTQPATPVAAEKKSHGHGGSMPFAFASLFLIFKILWDGVKRWGEMNVGGGGGGGHKKASGGHGDGHGGGHGGGHH